MARWDESSSDELRVTIPGPHPAKPVLFENPRPADPHSGRRPQPRAQA